MGQDDEPQISAADYDPSLDRREDEERRTRNQPSVDVNDGEADEEEVEEEEDLDDMFAAVSDNPRKTKMVMPLSKRSGHLAHFVLPR